MCGGVVWLLVVRPSCWGVEGYRCCEVGAWVSWSVSCKWCPGSVRCGWRQFLGGESVPWGLLALSAARRFQSPPFNHGRPARSSHCAPGCTWSWMISLWPCSPSRGRDEEGPSIKPPAVMSIWSARQGHEHRRDCSTPPPQPAGSVGRGVEPVGRASSSTTCSVNQSRLDHRERTCSPAVRVT